MGTAMIWGAGGGIGRALAAKLVADGWTVIAASRQIEEGDEPALHRVAVDVSDPDSVARAVAAAGDLVDRVNLWLYVAGDITAAKVADLEPADWQRIVDANLTGAYLAAHYSLPLLAPEAHLIFRGAVVERISLPRLAPYAASKAGLEALAAVLAKEERRRRVTVVRPAAVATSFWDKVPFKRPPDAAEPGQVAEQILELYHAGRQGVLDL
jgi:NAD(P)-dependent dehydrogenase (short-subunit alcohol dehydrogenase family)